MKIIISYVTAGTGHRRAAEAIADAARQSLPGAEVACVDLLTHAPWWVRWAYPTFYRLLVGYLPWCWALGYDALDHPWVFRACQPLRRCWNALMAGRFLRWVRSRQPDVVIATHFFPAEVLGAAHQAGRLSSRVIVVITDLFPHRLWLVPGADAVAVGSHETKALCQQRGVREDRLHVVGIPIGPGFGPSADRSLIASQLKLDPRRRTVLMVSGGMGLGPLHDLVRRVVALEATRPGQLQLLVVCGQNTRLMHQLQEVGAASAMPLRLFGFVDTSIMRELMGASDLLVTKGGGITIMEALATGLPMVFHGVIPGQEQFNAEYVVAGGAGVMTRRRDDVVGIILRVLDEPRQLEVMRAHAVALSKPQAAQQLIELINVAKQTL